MAIAALIERLENSPMRDLYSTNVIFSWYLSGNLNSYAYLLEEPGFLDPFGTYTPFALASSRLRASRALFLALSSLKVCMLSS